MTLAVAMEKKPNTVKQTAAKIKTKIHSKNSMFVWGFPCLPYNPLYVIYSYSVAASSWSGSRWIPIWNTGRESEMHPRWDGSQFQGTMHTHILTWGNLVSPIHPSAWEVAVSPQADTLHWEIKLGIKPETRKLRGGHDTRRATMTPFYAM